MEENFFAHMGEISHLRITHPSFFVAFYCWATRAEGPTYNKIAARARYFTSSKAIYDWAIHRCHDADMAFEASLRAALKAMGH